MVKIMVKKKQKVRSYKRRKKGGKRKTRIVREYDRTMKVMGDTAKLAIGATAVTAITTTAISALKE